FAGVPQTGDERFEGLLRAIDTVPTRAQLDHGWPDAKNRLLTAAKNDKRDDYTRLRALTMLSFYPDAPMVRAGLEALSSHPSVEVRRLAVYTMARTFGQPGDKALVAFVEAATKDPEPQVAEHAVRGLRWIDAPAAHEALSRLIQQGRTKTLKTLAARTSKRRIRRLAR
ncbi:MAG: HEAT repeat protein, partial [Myxococcota bacterium]